MSQLGLFDPQYECGLYEIWCHGIINTLAYRVNCGYDEPPYSIDDDLALEEKLVKCGKDLNLPEIRAGKPELYYLLLSKAGYLVRKACSDIVDPCDRYLFKSKFIDLILLNVLREANLLTESSEYFFEPILGIYTETNFGLPFIVDIIAEQGWYKYASRFLTHFQDTEQIDLIFSNLASLSNDFHLDVLTVIWHIESAIRLHDDDLAYSAFEFASNKLLNRSQLKTFDFRNNLAIYLTFINVTLEEILGSAARQAARIMGLDKPIDLEDKVSLDFPPVIVSFKCLRSLSEFINNLGAMLFPNAEYNDDGCLSDCFKDPKSHAIVEMAASIIEIYRFINVLTQEVTILSFDYLKFDGFESITQQWSGWENVVDTDELLCWEVLSLKRFFTKDHEECCYLTYITLKYGLPKYFDILEAIDHEIFLDPRILYTFGNLLNATTDIELLDDLILVLKRILSLIKSKRRVAAVMQARTRFFGLYDLGNVRESKLPLLLHTRSGSIKYDQVRDDIILSAFLSPYDFMEQILADGLEHFQNMIPFLARLFCNELHGICSAICASKFDNTFFEILIDGRLLTVPSENTAKGLLTLVKQVCGYYYNTKKLIEPPILSLERLSCLLLRNSSLQAPDIVRIKLTMFKLIQSLSESYGDEWLMVKNNPAPFLYSLLTLVDFFHKDGCLKVPVIDFMNFVMNQKVRRKLEDCELEWIRKRVLYYEKTEYTISNLAEWLDKRLYYYLKVERFCCGEALYVACTSSDNEWLHYRLTDKVEVTKRDTVSLMAHLYKTLTSYEFINLFYFLSINNEIEKVFWAMSEAYTSQDQFDLNVDYITKSLIDCFEFHCNNYLRHPVVYTRRFTKKLMLTKANLLASYFRALSMMYLYPGRTKVANQLIADKLDKLGQALKDVNFDAENEFFQEPCILSYEARAIIRKYYGPITVKLKEQKVKEPRLIPG